MPRLLSIRGSLLVALLAGCSPMPIESTRFAPAPAIERAIQLHYERYASEGEGRCFNPYIDGFTRLDVREDTPERLVVHARYFWRDRFQKGGRGESGNVCAGFNQRTFTLTRGADGDAVVVEMTGEQDEPAIRSLIRRLF